ncbi:MAG: transcriptional regulator NrdR [Candidatus Sumerlaeota bacterium]|nr:transcriptional regulator NrdR [Candidatus Sumerlaeota bacterium]
MKCPHCGSLDDKVVNSRLTPGGEMIRRRRECLSCQKRFTTIEQIEGISIKVIKRDGRREDFSLGKLHQGLDIACRKRDIPMRKLDELAANIQATLQNRLEKEVSAQEIGEMVLRGLREIDEVAYVRFASVYRKFRDVSEFQQELQALLRGEKKA